MQWNPEVLQKRVRILEMGTSAITGVYARGLFFEKRLNSTRAGRERKFHCGSAFGVSRNLIVLVLAGRENGVPSGSEKFARGM